VGVHLYFGVGIVDGASERAIIGEQNSPARSDRSPRPLVGRGHAEVAFPQWSWSQALALPIKCILSYFNARLETNPYRM